MPSVIVSTPSRSATSTRDGTSLIDLWHPASGRFEGVRLRRAIVVRGLTPEAFAQRTTCSRTSIYKALSGDSVRDRTAIAILEALQRLPPVLNQVE